MVAVAVDPFWTLALALLLDAAVGRPSWIRAPIAGVRNFFAGLADGCARRLNRPQRQAADLRIRGAFSLAALALGAGTLGFFLDELFAGGALAKAILVAAFFGQRAAFDDARAIDQERAPTDDAYSARRRAVSNLIARYSADVVGSALAYGIFGLAGLFAYAGALLAAQRFDPRDAAFEHFGAIPDAVARTALRLAAIPAALFIAAGAAFTPGGAPGKALGVALGAFAQSGARLRNGRPALAVAAFAAGFGLSFEGRDGWIGSGRARLEPVDGRKALYLYAVACLLHLTAWAGLGFLMAI